jgi:CheY-like chemotaxis protein
MWIEPIPERLEAWRYTGDINLLPDELMPVIRLTGGLCVMNSVQGPIECAVGDWIVCGAKGGIYICRDDTFRLSYSPAPDSGSVLFPRGLALRSTLELVVIVDDDAAIRRSTQRLLQSFGYATTTLTSAEEFLESEKVSRAIALVLDVDLEGMSGLDLCRQLKSSDRWLPTIVVTGSDDGERRAEAFALGCVDYLQKPLDSTALVRAIERGKASGQSHWFWVMETGKRLEAEPL